MTILQQHRFAYAAERRRRTAKTVQELEAYTPVMNEDGIPAIYDDELAEDAVFKSIKAAAKDAGIKFSLNKQFTI